MRWRADSSAWTHDGSRCYNDSVNRNTLVLSLLAVVCATPLLANTGWPSLYIFQGYLYGWFIVLPSILIEYLFVRWTIEESWSKSLWVTLVANGVSFIIGGAFCGYFGPILFYPLGIGDEMIETFPTLIWMFLITWGLEVLAVRLIFKYKFKLIAFPLGVANFLTHAIYLLLYLRVF